MDPKNIEKTSKDLWGKDLHKNLIAPVHSIQLEEIFQSIWHESLKGDLLEIGCGSGSDLAKFFELDCFDSITAIDLGENVLEISEVYKLYPNIKITMGNAMNLEFQDCSFDMVYSFGIFHHTSDPVKCFSEACRVLKNGGKIFLYVYSSHENFFFKRFGIQLEVILMKIMKFMPYKIKNFLCIVLSPFCWAIFSVPSIFIKLFGGKKFTKKIPFYWGTHPFSLIPDLKDRLMSPINHRFSYADIQSILENLKLSSFKIEDRASGMYIYAKK
jgi:SAM-dependent methyltransferase